jgi:hypothetical protein
MSAGTITDPDLTLAIEELNFVVRRLEQIDFQLLELDPVEGYSRIVAMRTERADLRERVRIRAEKLNVAPRALAILIGTANRMRSARKHQLPTLAAVRNQVEIVTDAAKREHAEAEADAKIALVVARGAALRAKAGADAMSYLDASRS